MFVSDAPFTNMQAWDDLARPWMTDAESSLFDALSDHERLKFRGTFVARRQERPQLWSEQGLFLPSFFCERRFNDVRDFIAYALGEPKQVVVNPTNPSVPSEWHFADYDFHFVPIARKRVTLTERGVQEWNRLKQRLILHPEILYSFAATPFGRTRLPDNITWFETQIVSYYLDPDPRGELLRVVVALSPSFQEALRSKGSDDEHVLELLIELDRGTGEPELRHDASLVRVLSDRVAVFEAHLPSGHFDAKFSIYSGFLPVGLTANTSLFVPPSEFPRISSPIIAQQWAQEGLIQPGKNELIIGGFRYRWDQPYDPSQRAMVLVHATELPAEVLIMRGKNQISPLEYINREGSWYLFELPPQPEPFRLIARTVADDQGLMGFRTFPPEWHHQEASMTAEFTPETDNYLELESLSFGFKSDPVYVTVANHPYLAVKGQSVPWLPFDWGVAAKVVVAGQVEGFWQQQQTVLRRSDVFTEISVRNQHLVVGARSIAGDVLSAPLPKVAGKQLKGLQQTPVKQLNQVWGLVFKDQVLESDFWPFVREELVRWLRENLKPDDLVYIVQISDRPMMVLPPTNRRAELAATLRSLQPSSTRQTSIDLRYLIDAITHLEYHTTRPHQVVLMTPAISDDIAHPETFLLELRQAGLQIYNLEFLDPRSPTTSPKIADYAMKMDEMEPETGAFRDNFSEERNTKAGFRIPLGEGKRQKARQQQAVKEEAAREAFSRQVELRTAGLSMSSQQGQERRVLTEFMRQMTQWYGALTYVELPVNASIDDVQFDQLSDVDVYWTTVDWSAP